VIGTSNEKAAKIVIFDSKNNFAFLQSLPNTSQAQLFYINKQTIGKE
jgi:hypothetical protein